MPPSRAPHPNLDDVRSTFAHCLACASYTREGRGARTQKDRCAYQPRPACHAGGTQSNRHCTVLCLSSCSASMHRPLYLYAIKLHFSRTIHLWLDPCHVYPHTAHVQHHARVHAHQLQYGPILVSPLPYPLPLTHTPTALLLRGAGHTNTRPPVCRTHPTATQPRTHTDT